VNNADNWRPSPCSIPPYSSRDGRIESVEGGQGGALFAGMAMSKSAGASWRGSAACSFAGLTLVDQCDRRWCATWLRGIALTG